MFKDNLKAARQKNKLSQRKVAEYLGVTQQSIAKWESGQSTPSPDSLAELALLFGMSLDDLVLSEEQKRRLYAKTGKSEAVEGSPKPKPKTDTVFYTAEDDSMSPEIKKGDKIIISLTEAPASGELALVSIKDEPAMIRRVIIRNGSYLLQPKNAAYSASYIPKSSADSVKIWGRVKNILRKW